MNFLKNILASIIGFWIALFLFILIGIGIALKFSSTEMVAIEKDSILEIDIPVNIKDYVSAEGSQLERALGFSDEVGLNQLLAAIQIATFDSKIKVISLKNLPNNLGWAQASEIRKALDSFKKAGKNVWAYGDFYSQKGYYVASVANKVVLSPVGSIDLNGIHSEVLFFKDFQEKYGVKMEVIRHGKYKSAVEPFIANEISDANRQQVSELITSIWQEVKKDIEQSRDVDTEDVVNNLKGRLPNVALASKLVDEVSYEDDYYGQIKSSISDNAKVIAIEDYMMNNLENILPIVSSNKIAIIYAQGEIIYGEGSVDIIGQNLFIEAIEEAVKNDAVKAIVLRINSPGGSALASDLIWNAIEKAKQEKPVIASMGNVAASGGYYIACNATRIFAEPTTITGSIGVFGILPNVSELSKKNGINSNIISTHNNNSYYSAVNPLNPQLKNTIQQGIEFVYNTFLDRVAQGRNMSIEKADSLAQGRVWSGVQAQQNGLVDELGGLEQAILHAAKISQVDNYNLENYPKFKMNFRDFIGGPLTKLMASNNILPVPKNIQEKIKMVDRIFKIQGTQARLPFELIVD